MKSYYELKQEVYQYAYSIDIPKGRFAGSYLIVSGNFGYKWAGMIMSKRRAYGRNGRLESIRSQIIDSCIEYEMISKDSYKNLSFDFKKSLSEDFENVSDNVFSISKNEFWDTFKIN